MLHFSKGKIILTAKLTSPQNMVLYEYMHEIAGVLLNSFLGMRGFSCSLF